MNIAKNTLRKIILEEISSLIEPDFEWLADVGRPGVDTTFPQQSVMK